MYELKIPNNKIQEIGGSLILPGKSLSAWSDIFSKYKDQTYGSGTSDHITFRKIPAEEFEYFYNTFFTDVKIVVCEFSNDKFFDVIKNLSLQKKEYKIIECTNGGKTFLLVVDEKNKDILVELKLKIS